jgi:hypothetical protein
MRLPALMIVSLALCACPAVNSTPCDTDAQCTASQRCRRGACGPICLNDGECGDMQVCRAGICKPPPECVKDSECASGFTCTADKCQCAMDSACAANQLCISGTCQARKRCTADADCVGTGQRCEVSQGLCLPICNMPADCAPGIDPRVALTLYSCASGTCTRRCLNDVTCGGEGIICKSGLCGTADCKTLADCPPSQYCTSATFGRCVAYKFCALNSECATNFECKKFDPLQCPPGFDCSKSVCLEQPKCLIDGDCVSGTTMMSQTGYCQESHCQPTAKCTSAATCGAGKECVGGLCVPSTCRGHSECGIGKACVDGVCVPAPVAADIALLAMSPTTALLEVGDTVQLRLVGFRLDASSYPLTSGTFSVVDEAGMPSTLASVDASGLVTGLGAGKVVVRGTVTGAGVAAVESKITIYAAVTAGRRVLVVDAATKAPLAGVKVNGCESASCATPTEVVTDATGAALFPALGTGAAIFTAVSQAVRTDGLPRFERASVIDTTSADVFLPLRENPVHSAAGFNAGISFMEVRTSGQYWAGLAAMSASDLPSVDLPLLLGENFTVQLPGIGQGVPVPGSLVLYTSPGFGIPQEIKGKSLGLGQAGNVRHAVAFAGRADLDAALALRSTQFLSYVGAFDYTVQTNFVLTDRARIPDATDIDGDGLCANMTKCPMGSEDVPDYANFTPMNFTPKREQKRRTEVVLPRLPSTLDTVVIAAAEVAAEGGLLPIGFSSVNAGPAGPDGTKMVPAVVLRSGTPYGGLELATPGIWALGGNNAGNSYSGRLTRGPTLPVKVLVAPFLPVPGNPSYQVAGRSFAPGQPQWSSVYSSGGELARVSLTGSQQRHVLYFAIASAQTTITVPAAPTGPGTDPASQGTVKMEVVAVDLANGTSVEDVFTLKGVNLSSWVTAIDGYSRFDK